MRCGATEQALRDRFVRGLGAQEEIMVDERGCPMSYVVQQVVGRDPNV